MRNKIFYRIKDMIMHIGTQWDKLSLKIDEAVEYAHIHINQEPQKYIQENHYTYEYRLAHFGVSINNRFRQDRADKDDLATAFIVSKNTTDTDLVLYRGVDHYIFNLMQKNAKKYNDCDLYEKGFLATSLVKGYEINSKIKLRIKVPAGTKCVYMGNVNDELEYYEVDVMHGSKLKIISIDNEYINCELLSTA